jgi:hypothetical protein
VYREQIVVMGGKVSDGTSTPIVTVLGVTGPVGSGATELPGAVHDAAAAVVGGRLLLLGGGASEGSPNIIQVLPGPPRLVGALPQPLSDLAAATVRGTAYVLGGWNGQVLNPNIYLVPPGAPPTVVGRLPLPVRYPAVAAVAGRVLVAGGETSTGEPTTRAWSFDPGSGRVVPLPDLPVATDHTAGVSLDGHFCVVGGLRQGVFTDRIVCLRPGGQSWQPAGHLSAPVADLNAVPFRGGVAVLGGRGSSGPVATATLLSPS